MTRELINEILKSIGLERIDDDEYKKEDIALVTKVCQK